MSAPCARDGFSSVVAESARAASACRDRAALYSPERAGGERRRPQAAVADLLPLATRIALRGGTF